MNFLQYIIPLIKKITKTKQIKKTPLKTPLQLVKMPSIMPSKRISPQQRIESYMLVMRLRTASGSKNPKGLREEVLNNAFKKRLRRVINKLSKPVAK